MKTMSEQIITALQQAPEGLTSRQLSDVLGKRGDSVSACAYRLFLLGKVMRNREQQRYEQVRNTFRWRSK